MRAEPTELVRGHFGDVGDLAEMAFQRRGDAWSPRFRAGARQRGVHRDGREVDLRQRRRPASWKKAKMPASAMPIVSSVVATGRRDEGRREVHAAGRLRRRLPGRQLCGRRCDPPDRALDASRSKNR